MKTVVITGGTGSFGSALARHILPLPDVGTVRIFSRDEFKQSEMQKTVSSEKLRYFVGDVRDAKRLQSALSGADIVIHAAAMKQVPACEYNPFEAVQTNILGTQNLISACIQQGVDRALFISTDKAVDPVNLYGATKLVAEKLWLNANNVHRTKFSFTRWGNVLGTRGSVIPLFREQSDLGILTLTHLDMTRFWITIDQAVRFAWDSLLGMEGGEVFIPNLKSSRVIDLANAVAKGKDCEIRVTGIRQGEKLHETLGPGYVSNDPERLLTPEEVEELYESL